INPCRQIRYKSGIILIFIRDSKIILCFREENETLILFLSQSHNKVSCNFKQSCILPCSFQSYGEPILHWTQLESSAPRVHSYYDNQDQQGVQNQNFRGRTSLFQDQISRGNASLLLREVQLQDQGRYNCFISTVKGHEESIIRLSVDGMISTIRIHQDGNRITCSSEGIYPPPELTWSTEPPSNTGLQNRTTVHQTEEKLYDITDQQIQTYSRKGNQLIPISDFQHQSP
uniref:Ig-like domain-containing protein n=1 Tax=Xiphophorus couchianus TaxID=32473 RepID=A0A3B5L7P5_9TELE